MKKSVFILLAFLMASTASLAQDLSVIDKYMIELSETLKFHKGILKYPGVFKKPISLIESGDEFPSEVIEDAYNYLEERLSFLRVYKVNEKSINDGRAIGYVSVFGGLNVNEKNVTQVKFYYVFSNYRGRVIVHTISYDTL